MMLSREDAFCVMIDMQEKLVPAIAHSEQLVADCAMLLEGLRILGVPVLASQQYTKGLGATIPELESYTGGRPFEKITFSCWKDPKFREAAQAAGRKQVIICGTETHICVQQTVLEMLEAGFEVYLITDCVGSRFDRDKEIAFDRMRQAGAILTSAEAALFEMTVRGGSDVFKAISKLVKNR